MNIVNKHITLALALSLLGGCASGASREVLLERNIADVAIQDAPRCKRVQLYHSPDGSLWIGDPAKAR